MDPTFIPAVPYIRLDGGAPWLCGSRCGGCGTVMLGERIACAACGARDTVEQVRLSERGTLYNYTIVHRSFPGVPTPFISAIVDLDGGGSLRGTLTGVTPDPAAIARDLPVRLVFGDSGQKARSGEAFLAFHFVPAEGNGQ